MSCKRAILLGATLLIVTVTGCQPAARLGVSGTVELDGAPLADGTISFRPQPGTEGPSGGSPITAGEYLVEAEKGLVPGAYLVEIQGWRKTGRQTKTMTGHVVDEIEHIVPVRYNDQTELTADISRDTPTEFDFQLTSD